MTSATIEQRVKGMPAQDGAGVKLTRVIGQPLLRHFDPFLMLDEFGSESAEDYLPGFPPHPHRGFQTVTYMLNGSMRHRDSVGNEGVISSGGIQWMNAGKGIIHEEMPEQQNGLLRGFQLWVNLPASQKMSAPDYQDIASEEVPTGHWDNGVSWRQLSGELEGVCGPVQPFGHNEMPLFSDFTASTDVSALSIPLHGTFRYFMYVYEGQLEITGQTVGKGELVTLNTAEQLDVKSIVSGTKWILVGGKPLKEPIVQYGPFVMNTEAEIQQALLDYQNNRLTQ